MRRFMRTLLAAALLFTLAACGGERMPQPAFPLSEEDLNAALADSGVPGEISPSETASSREGQISYSLRDPDNTYEGTENHVLTASIITALVDGGRYMCATFLSPHGEAGTLPFVWEDWKSRLVLSARLFGGFEDEEELYRELSKNAPPDGDGAGEWALQLSAGYCVVRYLPAPGAVSGHGSIYSYSVSVYVYESRDLYDKVQQQLEEARDAQTQPDSGA